MTISLVLLSGLPGTGKTRLAIELSKQFHMPVFMKDRFQSQLRLQGFVGREGAAGYELLFDVADHQLSLGIGAILDAVFPMDGFRQRAKALAEHYGAHFRPILCFCSDDVLLKKRMENRNQYVPDWTPVGWDEVEKIRAYFESWEENSVLHLDAINDFGANLSRALEWIKLDNEAR
jgi:predicted kinase